MIQLYLLGFVFTFMCVALYLVFRIERAKPGHRRPWVLLLVFAFVQWLLQVPTFMYLHMPDRAFALLEFEATPPSRAMPAVLAGLDLDAVQAQLGLAPALTKEQRRNPSYCTEAALYAQVFWGRTTLERYQAFLETDFAKWHAKRCVLQSRLAVVVHEYAAIEQSSLRYVSGMSKLIAIAVLPNSISNNPEIVRRIAAVKKEQE